VIVGGNIGEVEGGDTPGCIVRLLVMLLVGSDRPIVAILFGSIELVSLQYHVFPPYGLITEAFLPLGAYLVFVGIFVSAGQISRNAELRKEFKSVSSQLALLKAIRVSQMEKELEKMWNLLTNDLNY
jgi:hypothetical protein